LLEQADDDEAIAEVLHCSILIEGFVEDETMSVGINIGPWLSLKLNCRDCEILGCCW